MRLSGAMSGQMEPGHFTSLQCACGHRVMLWMQDMPAHWLNDPPWSLRDEVLARLVCRRCGRRGRPAEIRIGWSAGKGSLPQGR